MEKPETGLMFVAGERVILPDGRVTPGAWPELAAAILLEPEPAELRIWLARIEERLGVKDQHRAAMEARAVSAVEGSEAKRRRLLEQSMRAAQLAARPRDPEFVSKIAKAQAALAAARAEAEDPPGKSDRQKRKAAKVAKSRIVDATAKLADLCREEGEQSRLYGDAESTILSAQARGEQVIAYEAETAEVARDKYGARILAEREDSQGRTYYEAALVYGRGLRAKRMSGPEQAMASGYLAGGPLPAEMAFRAANEYREAYLYGEGQISGGGGEGGGGFGPKAPQPKRAEEAQALADMRRLLPNRLRTVLDLVCGQDMRVSEARRALGDGDDRTTARALRIGLDTARKGRMGAVLARQTAGTAGDLVGRIAAGNAMLASVRG